MLWICAQHQEGTKIYIHNNTCSWSQVLQRKLLKHRKEAAQSQVILVAVDLQEMAPLEGVITMQGDITNETTAQQIIAHFGGQRAQLVVCDGAPDVTGMHDIDEYLQSQLILAALNITTHLLDENGTFVAKVFKSKDIHLLTSQLNIFFKQVYVTKPKSSRLSSIESFVVCKDFCMPQEYVPQMINPLDAKLYAQQLELNKKTEQVQHIVPYLACGDLSSFDST